MWNKGREWCQKKGKVNSFYCVKGGGVKSLEDCVVSDNIKVVWFFLPPAETNSEVFFRLLSLNKFLLKILEKE